MCSSQTLKPFTIRGQSRSSFIITCVVLWIILTSAAILFAERCRFFRIFSRILLILFFVRTEHGRPDLDQYLHATVPHNRCIVLCINILLKLKYFKRLNILLAENPRSKNSLTVNLLTFIFKVHCKTYLIMCLWFNKNRRKRQKCCQS